MNDLNKLKERIRGARLRVQRHELKPNAVNAYMIANEQGVICGGNIAVFITWEEFNTPPFLAYPKVFKSRASGLRHLKQEQSYLRQIEEICATNRLR